MGTGKQDFIQFLKVMGTQNSSGVLNIELPAMMQFDSPPLRKPGNRPLHVQNYRNSTTLKIVFHHQRIQHIQQVIKYEQLSPSQRPW
jgi:hypothetical protein